MRWAPRRSAASARSALVALLLWSAAGRAEAAPEPLPDPRLRVVDYRPHAVLPLTAFVGYHVDFEFAPDERFVNLGSGDTASLDVGAEGNHLLLKPRQPSSGTNLTILTNRRVYYVDYRALARVPRPDEAVYSIVFRYPEGDAGREAAAKAPVSAAAPLDAPRPALNTDYWYCGSPALRPVAASDDGLQLRLRFAPHAALPAVFVAEPSGEESLVNTHVEDDTVVVHRLTQRLVLRRGDAVGCVVDRGADRGHRAASGTVVNGVARETREVRE